MTPTKHHTFDTLYRRFADYGREIPTDGTEKCPDEITLAMSALMRIVGVVDCVSESLAKKEIDRRFRDAFDRCLRRFAKWRTELEAKHGNCPESIHHYLYRLARLLASEYTADTAWWKSNYVDAYVTPSDMPTNVRKDYDRWRKRKAKKEPTK